MNFIVSLPPNFFIINQKQIKMRINSEIRALARRELHDYWMSPVLATLILVVIGGIADKLSNTATFNATGLHFVDASNPFFYARTSVGFFISLLVVLPLSFGFSIAILRFIRGEKENVIENMFNEFKNYGRALGVSLLTSVFTFLWTLLFIIPGIIKHYSYGMTFYIAKDHPELGADDCIEESKKMMYGHKMRLFLLDLSFIGWALLCILTLGIGLLWLYPYIETSHAIFYKELKAELYPEMEDAGSTVAEDYADNGMEFNAEFEN